MRFLRQPVSLRRGAPRSRQRYRLTLENLEDRTVPSPLNTGDIFASVSGLTGDVQHYDSSANLLETLQSDSMRFTTGMAFDAAGNLFVTNYSPSGSITEFRKSDGARVGVVASGLGSPESIVFDAMGHAYVADGDPIGGGGTMGGITKFDTSGATWTVLQTYPIGETDFIDLLPDQHTIRFTNRTSVVKQFDVSGTGSPLADFASLTAGVPAYDLRNLPDGGALVADSTAVIRLDAKGNVVQQYKLGTGFLFPLTLSNDGTSFLTGDYNTGIFYKIDIATGAQVGFMSKNTLSGTFNLFGIAQVGEVRVALIPPTVTAPANQKASEGASQSFSLGTITDLGTGPWNVTVNWGDMTPAQTFAQASNGTINPESHTYSEEGTYGVVVTVLDSANTLSGITSFGVTVADPAVVATPVNVIATAGKSFFAPVATFTDPAGGEPFAASYTATIDWGDKSMPGTGSISNATVSGTHTYAAAGTYTITCTINHEGIITTVMSTATVSAPQPPVVTAPANQNAVEGVAQGFLLGSFTDPDGGPWNVDVKWGDGTADTTFSASAPGSLVNQNHTYGEEGTETVTVMVTDSADGQSDSKTFQVAVSDPAVLGTAGSVSATADTAFTGPVATFTDPAGAEANDGMHYTATIDWGDKTAATTGTITVTSGTFTVSGSHTYGASGSFTITCTINHEGVLTMVQSPAGVGTPPPPVVTAASNQNAVEGAGQSFSLGSFSDTIGGPWNVDVKWGDGTADTTFSATAAGSLAMQSHTYTEEGSETVTIMVTDTADGLSGSKTFQVAVSDPVVVGTAVSVSATAGTAFSGPVATFTDPGGAEANDGTHYTASIDWGDKTAATTGTIAVSSGTFTVSGGHTYAAAGSFTITCTINHETVLTTVMSPATVSSGGSQQPPVVTCAPINAIAGAPFNGAVASFTDADGGTLNRFSAKLDWGDGVTSTGTVAANGSGFTVSGSHTYTVFLNYTLTVQVNDTDGSSGSASCPVNLSFVGSFSNSHENATINFWAGTKGQALIDSFNGGPSSTALAAWLASSFPNLYGTNAGADNLTGKTNAQVAALFETFFAEPHPAPDAQALTLALDIYATTSSLGGTAASAYGFDVTSTGLGAELVFIGGSGAAFGAPNNAAVVAYDLLNAANAQAVNGQLYNGNAGLLQEFLDVVFALNDTGMNG